jgi:hypothetical protein
MKICTVALCLLALPGIAQIEENSDYLEFFLSYDSKTDSKLSIEEESELLGYVYDLFLSPEVTIELLSCGSSFQAEEIMEERTAYFNRMCLEYGLTDSTTRVTVVNGRFDNDPRADVRISFLDPLLRKRVARAERRYTHSDGWRVSCFEDELPFMRQTQVTLLSRPEEFENLQVLTCDEDGHRLEILAIVSVNFVRDTTLAQAVKFHIPLHGMETTGCKEFMLMSSDRHTFLSSNGKASVKRDDGVMIWKVDATRSGTFVIARPTTDQFSVTFTAPEGFAIVSGVATGSSPYLMNSADISLSQLTATFSSLPNPENVYCEFVLSDMDGNLTTTPKMSAAALMHEPLLGYFKRNEHVLPLEVTTKK